VGELQSILDRTRVPTVLVTHDAQEAEALAEELILMEGGAVAGVRDERRG
jgi:ABC-type sulfate/molybdate transport systems ATPase subunit